MIGFNWSSNTRFSWSMSCDSSRLLLILNTFFLVFHNLSSSWSPRGFSWRVRKVFRRACVRLMHSFTTAYTMNPLLRSITVCHILTFFAWRWLRWRDGRWSCRFTTFCCWSFVTTRNWWQGWDFSGAWDAFDWRLRRCCKSKTQKAKTMLDVHVPSKIFSKLTSLRCWMVASQAIFEVSRNLNALRLHNFKLLTLGRRSLLSPFSDRLEACCVTQQRFTPFLFAISVVHLFTCLQYSGASRATSETRRERRTQHEAWPYN